MGLHHFYFALRDFHILSYRTGPLFPILVVDTQRNILRVPRVDWLERQIVVEPKPDTKHALRDRGSGAHHRTHSVGCG
jgi:hypothetical protein